MCGQRPSSDDFGQWVLLVVLGVVGRVAIVAIVACVF
jgi:hypothetical protein